MIIVTTTNLISSIRKEKNKATWKFPFSRPIVKHAIRELAPKNRRSFFLSLSLSLSLFSFHHSSSIVNQPRDALNARDDARPSVPWKWKKKGLDDVGARRSRRRRKVDTCKKNSARDLETLPACATWTTRVPREMLFGRFLPLSREAERRRVDENWSEKNSAKLGKNKRRIDCTVLEIIRKKRKIYTISSKIVQQHRRRCGTELEYWNSITIPNNSGNNLRDRASAEARKQRDNEICVPRRYRYIVQERDSIFSVSILSRNK